MESSCEMQATLSITNVVSHIAECTCTSSVHMSFKYEHVDICNNMYGVDVKCACVFAFGCIATECVHAACVADRAS